MNKILESSQGLLSLRWSFLTAFSLLEGIINDSRVHNNLCKVIYSTLHRVCITVLSLITHINTVFAALLTPITNRHLIKGGRNHPQGTQTTCRPPLTTKYICLILLIMTVMLLWRDESCFSKHCDHSAYVMLICLVCHCRSMGFSWVTQSVRSVNAPRPWKLSTDITSHVTIVFFIHWQKKKVESWQGWLTQLSDGLTDKHCRGQRVHGSFESNSTTSHRQDTRWRPKSTWKIMYKKICFYIIIYPFLPFFFCHFMT